MSDAASTRVRWADPGDAPAVAARIAAELAHPGTKRFAFPGGSTPLKVLDLLAAEPLDWSDCTLCLTDDRQVPDDHPASNHAKLVRALGGSAVTIDRLTEGDTPAPFDLVWLGMGEDGHVASLFPEMTAHLRPGRAVIATQPIPLPPEAPFARLSLNLPALLATKALILVITGGRKRALVEAVLAAAPGDAPRINYPVASILTGEGPPVTIYWSE